MSTPDYAALRAVAEDYGDWFRAALEKVRAWEKASPRSEAVLADDEGTAP